MLRIPPSYHDLLTRAFLAACIGCSSFDFPIPSLDIAFLARTQQSVDYPVLAIAGFTSKEEDIAGGYEGGEVALTDTMLPDGCGHGGVGATVVESQHRLSSGVGLLEWVNLWQRNGDRASGHW